MKLRKSHIKEEWSEAGSGDGYWISLKSGWKWDGDPVGAVHFIHEGTRAEAWREGVLPCNCEDCSKEGQATKFSDKLEAEIKFQQDTFAESADLGESLSRDQAIRRLMEDMDNRDCVAYEFRRELQDYGARIGIFKANTKAQLDQIVTLGRGKKYDFKRGDVYYVFNDWGPLKTFTDFTQ